MRDLKECKAEVFRRSKKRTNERRKKISRALAFCVPLFLVITVWSVTRLHTITYGGINGEPVTDGDIDNNFENTAESSFSDVSKSEDIPSKSPGTDHIVDATSFPEPADSKPGTSDSSTDIKDDPPGSKNPETSEATPPGIAEEPDPAEAFSFSLHWVGNGMSSYDSKTGELIETYYTPDSLTPDVPDEEITASPAGDITVYCPLTYEQKHRIYDLISELDLSSYPDYYYPDKVDDIEIAESYSTITLILSVSCDDGVRTITAENIAYIPECYDEKGQKFLGVCKAIEEILAETEERNKLPE